MRVSGFAFLARFGFIFASFGRFPWSLGVFLALRFLVVCLGVSCVRFASFVADSLPVFPFWLFSVSGGRLVSFPAWDRLPVLILFGFHRLPVWGGAVAFLEGFTRSGFASFGLFAF